MASFELTMVSLYYIKFHAKHFVTNKGKLETESFLIISFLV